MKTLAFRAPSQCAGKRVRHAAFEERSSLPVSAVCVVASGLRERLSASLQTSVVLQVTEPAVPTVQAWTAITNGASLYGVFGSVLDAAIVLRGPDACALAAAAFGENGAPPKCELSTMEREVVDRIVSAVAGALAPVCGTLEARAPERLETIAGFVTYFEAIVEMPVSARIGIALSRDPETKPPAAIEAAELSDIVLDAVAYVDLGTYEAGAMAALAPGAILPITGSSTFRGSLRIGGRTLAKGACGAYRGRYALEIEG